MDKSQNYKVVALPEQVYNNITLRELNDGRIAVGSENTGLAIINPADLSICRYTEKNGLCDNTIYAILQDKNNQIWLSTNQGLCKCNPDFSLLRIIPLMTVCLRTVSIIKQGQISEVNFISGVLKD